MSRQLTALLAVSSLLLGGCATISNTIDSINPFSSSAPKMAPLLPLNATADVRTVWSVNIGKAAPIVNVASLWSTIALFSESMTLNRQFVLGVLGTCHANVPIEEGYLVRMRVQEVPLLVV